MAYTGEYLFAYMHPTEASNITLSLAAGTLLEAYKLSIHAVLPVIALAYIAWTRNQAIVDDYALLCQRYRDEYLLVDFKYFETVPWCPAIWYVGYIVEQERGGRNTRRNVLEDGYSNKTAWLFETYDRLIDRSLEDIWL